MTSLLDNIDLHVMPSMNPDGFERKTRHNAHGRDLNRAFPTWAERSESRAARKSGREPEVSAVMDWVEDNPFVLSINFHDGAVVANYPWDDKPAGWDRTGGWFTVEGGNVVTPDRDVFLGLAEMYASKHRNMHKG